MDRARSCGELGEEGGGKGGEGGKKGQSASSGITREICSKEELHGEGSAETGS